MDYSNLVKQSFAWYKNMEFWKWIGGFTAILVVFYALLIGAALVSAPSAGAAAPPEQMMPLMSSMLAGAVVFIILLVLAAVFVQVKILTIALRQGGLKANSITLLPFAKYIALMLLIAVAAVVAIGAAVLLGILLAGIFSFAKIPALTMLVLIVYALLAAAAFFYACARLSLVSVHFWSKENCGIFESMRRSLDSTNGHALEIIIGMLLLGLALLVVGIALWIVAFVLLLVLALLSAALAAVFAPLGIVLMLLAYVVVLFVSSAMHMGPSPYWAVELMRQLSGKQPAPAKKGAQKKTQKKNK